MPTSVSDSSQRHRSQITPGEPQPILTFFLASSPQSRNTTIHGVTVAMSDGSPARETVRNSLFQFAISVAKDSSPSYRGCFTSVNATQFTFEEKILLRLHLGNGCDVPKRFRVHYRWNPRGAGAAPTNSALANLQEGAEDDAISDLTEMSDTELQRLEERYGGSQARSFRSGEPVATDELDESALQLFREMREQRSGRLAKQEATGATE